MMKVYVLIVRHFGAEDGDVTNENVWVYETMAGAVAAPASVRGRCGRRRRAASRPSPRR